MSSQSHSANRVHETYVAMVGNDRLVTCPLINDTFFPFPSRSPLPPYPSTGFVWAPTVNSTQALPYSDYPIFQPEAINTRVWLSPEQLDHALALMAVEQDGSENVGTCAKASSVKLILSIHLSVCTSVASHCGRCLSRRQCRGQARNPKFPERRL